MDSQRTGSTYEAGHGDGSVGAGIDPVVTATTPPVGRAETRLEGVRPATQVGENVPTARNRVQWGPIVAGLLSAIASMIVLTVLGLAIGASALEPTAPGEEIGRWAAVWGGISAIVSFFIGGWIAAKTAAVGGQFAGLMNGLMVGASGLALILWLTGTGLGNLLGTVGTNIGDIANVAQQETEEQGVTATGVQSQAADVAANVETTARNSFDEIEDGAWGTLGGLVLALGAAALGGLVGYNKRRDLIEGTGAG